MKGISMRKSVLLIFSCILIVNLFVAVDVYAHSDITPAQAKDLIDTNPALRIVDVRTPSEYCDNKHIPGAINLPWPDVFQQQYQQLPIDAEILVVCWSGHRSDPAAQFLDSQGYPHVYDMTGGMSAWQWELEPCCSSWAEVITKYTNYADGTTTWTDVISCYQEYVS